MTETTSAARASKNGHDQTAVVHVGPPEEQADQRGLLERLVRGVAGAVSTRIPVADLDERDPDYIRDNLPWLWLLASLYYRGEGRGLGHTPERGPVLLVG